MPTTFAQLPEHTREWLESISTQDVKDYQAALATYRAINTLGRFSKWLILTMLAVFTGAAAFGQALAQLAGWFKGVSR